MKKFKLLLILVAMLFSTLTFAQINFGVKVGGNLNSMMFDIDSDYGEEPESTAKLGFHIGLVVDIPVLENTLSVQSGLLYNNKGYGIDFEKMLEDEGLDVDKYEGYLEMNYNYLEVPINIVYRNNGFQVSAGPYLALGVGGSFENNFSFEVDGIDYESEDFFDENSYELQSVLGTVDNDIYEDFLDDDDVIELYNALDLGLNLSVGYQVESILFNIGYSFGLSNITPNYDADNYGLDEDNTENVIQQNRVFTISIAYFFN